MGGDGVLSTPSMIGLMERTSIQAVQDYRKPQPAGTEAIHDPP